MYISQIFDRNDYILYGEDKNIEELAIHSAYAGKNCLFFAHKGIKTDGNEHVFEAISRGAVAVCTEDISLPEKLDGVASVIIVKDSYSAESYASSRFYHRDIMPKIIGVTGTNGKTSVCHIAQKISVYLGKKSAYIGTLGTDITCEKLPVSNTTLPPSYFHKLISVASESSVEQVFCELSSQGIVNKRCEHTDFHTLIFTNLTYEHLDTHGDMKSYYEAKASIFRNTEAFCIINTDDPYGKMLYEELNNVKFSVGFADDSDVMISDFTELAEGIEFTLTFPSEESVHISVPLHGRFNAYNIAFVCSALYTEGFNPADICDAVNTALTGPVKGRMELYEFEGINVYVDYAHTPDALRAVFESTVSVCKGRILSVFGCGGERDRGKRCVMGHMACEFSDFVLITSDNNRSESFSDIASDILKGCSDSEVIVIKSRKKAIIKALSMAEKGDYVLIMGRGAEEYIIESGIDRKFSDREFVAFLCK